MKPEEPVCNKRCMKCKYGMNLSGFNQRVPCCCYMERTGKRRDCPPGDACTKFEKSKRKKKSLLW